MKYLIHCLLLFFSFTGFAQSPIGIWKTVDDNTGDARSHVEIYKQKDLFFGKIVKILDEDPNILCEKCPGDKKDTPVVGLVIIEGLKPYKDYWKKGKILDPETGNLYNCQVWLEDGNLKVRGKHWTGLYRTQTWYKVDE